MQFFAVGINYKQAPLAARKRLVFDVVTLPQALNDLLRTEPIQEAAILSTCNRTELYCLTEYPQAAARWLARYQNIARTDIDPFLYTYEESQAVRHVFRVACGLDSMVLGETQILGQLKQAASIADEAGTLGLWLNHLFQQTFSVAKHIRSHTSIGAHAVSFASASIRLAKRIFGEINEQNVLLVGSGEMIRLCLAHIASLQPAQLTIASRSMASASLLAERFRAQAITLGHLGDELGSYDIILTCTASPLPIIGLGMVERALRKRRYRPMVIVDLAVPGDCEPEIKALDDVFFYDIDDLGSIITQSKDQRQDEARKAEALIDEQVIAFERWVESRQATSAIRFFRDSADNLRRDELTQALRRLHHGQDPVQVLEAFSQSLMHKWLHVPTKALREANPEVREQLVRLFHQK